MTNDEIRPGRRYLEHISRLIDRVATEEWTSIAHAARLVADALAGGRAIHAFGSGHSHMLAEEMSTCGRSSSRDSCCTRTP